MENGLNPKLFSLSDKICGDLDFVLAYYANMPIKHVKNCSNKTYIKVSIGEHIKIYFFNAIGYIEDLVDIAITGPGLLTNLNFKQAMLSVLVFSIAAAT